MTSKSSVGKAPVFHRGAHGATVAEQRDVHWWHGAAIYQIYPRSFQDSNNDGIGDLPGIIERLPYVASLGVDGIWLSPFFRSPMDDFGYDVSDFCDVDPIFGTLDDFDRLIETAHRLNLKVTIDQVYSHTSNQHPWFEQSRQDRHNARADWYVWADPRPDGTPPTNWLSVFGGSAWQWDSRREQYYLHNFLTTQPDLNLHNKAVQEAALNVARFWLKRGVDGFRLDALNFAMHDEKLRDNPPATSFKWPPKTPFDYQEHIRNKSHPGISGFVKRIRDVMDEFPGSFTVAEVGGPYPLEEMRAFTAGEEHLNSAYDFGFLYADALDAELIRSALRDWPGEPGEGWPSWAFSNHDAPRAVSRWCRHGDQAQYACLLALVLCSLRGNVFVYQGEELALAQADVPFESLRDPEAIANWPTTLGRDGARTPMPWTDGPDHAGFSSTAPWLPMDARHPARSVSALEADSNSSLHFFRRALELRKNTPALRLGALEFLDEDYPRLLVMARHHQNQRAVVVANLTTDPLPLPRRLHEVTATALQAGDYAPGDTELAAHSGFIVLD